MAQVTIQPRAARRSPIEMVVDKIWRFFCSVRAAIYEIAILAVLVLIGTLRGSEVPHWIEQVLPVTAPVVNRWYDFDVFHSLPFMLILGVLSVAITVCTINRAPGIWRTIAEPNVGTNHGFIRGAEVSASFRTAGSPESVTDLLTRAFNASRYRVLTERRGEEIHLYADRNRFAKLGTFPFHLALILILVGGIVGARYGFREMEFVIPEGSVRDVGHGTNVSVQLDRFTDTYRENGVPLEYRSNLVIYDNGEPVKNGSITVNHPISYRSMTFYQSGFGQAVSLRVTDNQGQVLFDDSVALGLYQSRTNPDAPAGILELPQAGLRLHVIGPDENPANQPELDDLQLRSGEMFVQARHLGPDAPADLPDAVVAQGSTANIAGVNVEFVRERRYTILQVGSNPGIPIFFVAAFLLVGGLAITFYFPHRRIRGIVAPAADTPAGSTATIAPLVKRDWSGRRDFDRLLERLQERLDVRATIRTNEKTLASETDSDEASQKS